MRKVRVIFHEDGTCELKPKLLFTPKNLEKYTYKLNAIYYAMIEAEIYRAEMGKDIMEVVDW